MPISKLQQDFLAEQLEECLDSSSGVYLIECSPSKAKYIQNLVRRITRLHTYESLTIYKPGEPLYGKSIYQKIRTAVTEHGLYLIRVPDPVPDPPLTILDAAISNEERRIHPATRKTLVTYSYHRHTLSNEETLPASVRRAVALTSIALSDDVLSIQPVSIGHAIREVPREQIANLLRIAADQDNEKNPPEPLDNEPPMS